ncbi:SDR family oxidoreductase [Nocardia goodfellowii]|uniref:NAD(P)-dependent dehydrogenase (Short-subunit alcohol dehydrogenase family) n=1 Tax=Nocardia goodfellowii TaxID=882446 RepID=A0ABS4Q9D5_9NOCA|nr:SDR family oxidoreductase [Nocardia goodfellowii]MBP2187719.1 NAD(P)-dependent dehydrogenase (short-subunit alcohol dehydrogenase family) [Nocardia goodfellowii]
MTTTKQIALITGANRGIGYETARQLGERGMTVLVGARSAERGAEAVAKLAAAGIDARPLEIDATDAGSIARAADWIAAEFGHLDVLVNNAGIAGDFGQPSETALNAMREVFETNVFGVVAVTNALLPLLRNAPAARIVQVSSEVGSIGFLMDQTSPLWPAAAIPYPASKAALNMVTAMYAKELWDTPIKVNAANPGYCATEFNGNSGFRTAEQGAEVSVALATLPADGPTGQLWGYRWGAEDDTVYAQLPW